MLIIKIFRTDLNALTLSVRISRKFDYFFYTFGNLLSRPSCNFLLNFTMLDSIFLSYRPPIKNYLYFFQAFWMTMNGFSTGEDDSRGASDQICCLVDDNERCKRPAGNASYSKRIQKTVTQRRLKLHIDNLVSIKKFKKTYGR